MENNEIKNIYESPELTVLLTDDSDIVLASSGNLEEIPFDPKW
ncbi:MAG: hypothetical protein ACI3YK_08125 [Eubacteriales bacterium]